MEIINNLSEENHKSKIVTLFEKSDVIIIVSPFLMPNFDEFLNIVPIQPNSTIEIITTLHPNVIEQFRKVDSLLSFCKHPKIQENSINVQVSINNKLHGKLYFFEGENFEKLIISSANFTNNGLVKNHEWGIEIDDKNKIESIKSQINQSIQKRNITLVELENMKEACDKFKEKNKVPNPKIDLNLISLIPTNTSKEEFPETVRFWIKPIGVTEAPISIGRKFENLEQPLNFSTGRKPKIRIGDILIGYGVGAKQILSIYRAEELPEYETEEAINAEPWKKRWAWYINGKNLTPNFGGNWWTHNFNAFDLVREFKRKNPDISITQVGGDTLGGLNFGHDKLELKREFAEFIIGNVIERNRNEEL